MTEPTGSSTVSLPSDHRSGARDALHGLAVGDAFGAQFFVPENLVFLHERRLPPAPWLWTDDTEMTCSLFDALRLRGTVDHGNWRCPSPDDTISTEATARP
jgi:ADP-ribosylglycohydrolase